MPWIFSGNEQSFSNGQLNWEAWYNRQVAIWFSLAIPSPIAHFEMAKYTMKAAASAKAVRISKTLASLMVQLFENTLLDKWTAITTQGHNKRLW